MDDVGRGDQQADVGVDRQDQPVVGVEQPDLALLQVLLLQQVGVEGEVAIVGVFVGPVPLVLIAFSVISALRWSAK
jgi:hypothetical protein